MEQLLKFINFDRNQLNVFLFINYYYYYYYYFFICIDTDAITVSINNTDVTLSEGDDISLCASTNGTHSVSFNVTGNASSPDGK